MHITQYNQMCKTNKEHTQLIMERMVEQRFHYTLIDFQLWLATQRNRCTLCTLYVGRNPIFVLLVTY